MVKCSDNPTKWQQKCVDRKDITIISSFTLNNLYMNLILMLSMSLIFLSTLAGNYPRAVTAFIPTLKK